MRYNEGDRVRYEGQVYVVEDADSYDDTYWLEGESRWIDEADLSPAHQYPVNMYVTVSKDAESYWAESGEGRIMLQEEFNDRDPGTWYTIGMTNGKTWHVKEEHLSRTMFPAGIRVKITQASEFMVDCKVGDVVVLDDWASCGLDHWHVDAVDGSWFGDAVNDGGFELVKEEAREVLPVGTRINVTNDENFAPLGLGTIVGLSEFGPTEDGTQRYDFTSDSMKDTGYPEREFVIREGWFEVVDEAPGVSYTEGMRINVKSPNRVGALPGMGTIIEDLDRHTDGTRRIMYKPDSFTVGTQIVYEGDFEVVNEEMTKPQDGSWQIGTRVVIGPNPMGAEEGAGEIIGNVKTERGLALLGILFPKALESVVVRLDQTTDETNRWLIDPEFLTREVVPEPVTKTVYLLQELNEGTWSDLWAEDTLEAATDDAKLQSGYFEEPIRVLRQEVTTFPEVLLTI